jgi:hypothetical protein
MWLDGSGIRTGRIAMNWKSLLFTLGVVCFIGAITYGAIWGSDDVDAQVERVEESIVERFGDETWEFETAKCPRFDALDDGEKITCTATAMGEGGRTAPANVVVTLEDCEVGNGDDAGESCDFSSRWTVE